MQRSVFADTSTLPMLLCPFPATSTFASRGAFLPESNHATAGCKRKQYEDVPVPPCAVEPDVDPTIAISATDSIAATLPVLDDVPVSEFDLYIAEAVSIMAQQLCDKLAQGDSVPGAWHADFDATITYLCGQTMLDIYQGATSASTPSTSALLKPKAQYACRDLHLSMSNKRAKLDALTDNVSNIQDALVE